MKPPTLPIVAYKRMGVQLAGSLGHAGGPFQQVIRMMAAGRMDMRQMVSARLPLEKSRDGVQAPGEPPGCQDHLAAELDRNL